MKTFTEPKELVKDRRYAQNRREALKVLDLRAIDPPIVKLIEGFSLLPQCFTLQSCYGHFLYARGQDPHNLERLPSRHEGPVTYRIAYIALCLENSLLGRSLRESLEHIPAIDPEYVQFGSASWFWGRQRNTYALQVEPYRLMTEDEVVVEHAEALHIEQVRDLFFIKLGELLERHLGELRRG